MTFHKNWVRIPLLPPNDSSPIGSRALPRGRARRAPALQQRGAPDRAGQQPGPAGGVSLRVSAQGPGAQDERIVILNPWSRARRRKLSLFWGITLAISADGALYDDARIWRPMPKAVVAKLQNWIQDRENKMTAHALFSRRCPARDGTRASA